MERKIGEIFKYNGDWYQCVLGSDCKNCAFITVLCSDDSSIGYCANDKREDNKDVIFKKLKKVGEPYDFQKRTFQTYKLHTIPFFSEGVELVAIPSKDNNTIEIEIKQTKEDMVGKKLKPFDIQKAREGKSVYTRDGRKARIICFDAKCADTPIVALVSLENEEEYMYRYYRDGKFKKDGDSDVDLMMIPEKIEGWVNIDKGGSGKITISSPYSTKEEAIHNDNETTIDTIKICWEE